jgi:hypothetical protein
MVIVAKPKARGLFFFNFSNFKIHLLFKSALAGGILSLLLPETLGAPLVESIEEVEQLKNRSEKYDCH